MRKFTLLIASLFITIGAMAQFTQTIADVTASGTFGEVTEYPDGVTTAKASESTGEGCASTTVKSYTVEVGVPADGTATVKFQYNGGAHKLVILGVDLVDGEGTVVGSDYHYGYTGGSTGNNTYTMSGLTTGNYTLRYFFCHKPSDHEVGNQTATITVTGLTRDGYVAPLKYTELENGKVYTFVTQRGAMGASATSTNAISTARTTGDTNSDYFKWTVYKSVNENFYLYNIGKAQFLGEQSTERNASVPMSATPVKVTFKTTNLPSYPIMFKTTDNESCVVNHSSDFGEGLITWNGGWSDATDGGNCHVVTEVADLDAEILALVEAAVNAYESDNTEAVAALDAAIAQAEALSAYIGTGVGKYTYTGEGSYEEKFAAIVAFREGITAKNDPTPEAVEAKTAELQAVIASFSLNMPEKGKYYRFKDWNTDNYMLSDEYSSTRLAMGTNEVSSIFYYGEDGSLLSYANGCYLPKAVQSGDWTCLAVGTTGPAATFGEGTSVGTYGFYVGDDNTRAYYSGRDTYVDAGGTIAANNGYDWILEEVTELPVTVTAAGYATLYAPVAVTVPAGVTAHTVTINGEWATLSEALTTIPANTGVVLVGEGSHSFAITTADAFDGTNALEGTVAATYVTKDAYVLGVVDEKVGFYTATKNQADNNAFLNNANKAYLPASAVPNKSAAFYGFDWNGTTGIDEITDNREQSTVIYDLTGRRVETITEPGIYIVGGVKKLVR